MPRHHYSPPKVALGGEMILCDKHAAERARLWLGRCFCHELAREAKS